MKKHFIYFLLFIFSATFSATLGFAAFPVVMEQTTEMVSENSNLVKTSISSTSFAQAQTKHQLTKHKPNKEYDQYLAIAFCAIVGVFGVHRFYLGYPIIGILQILTFGGCGFWWIIDMVRLVLGDLKPRKAEYTRILDLGNM